MNIKSVKEILEKSVLEFDCDNYELNACLFKYARQNDKKSIAKTFVLADDSCIYV